MHKYSLKREYIVENRGIYNTQIHSLVLRPRISTGMPICKVNLECYY